MELSLNWCTSSARTSSALSPSFPLPPSSVHSLAACHIFSFYPLCLHQFTPHPGPESSGLAMAHLPNTVILTLEMSGRFMFLILSLESHVILRAVGGGCKTVEKERTEKERERVGWQRSRLSVYSLASTLCTDSPDPPLLSPPKSLLVPVLNLASSLV